MPARSLSLLAPSSMPSIGGGDDLATEILGAFERDGIALADGDIVAVAQKIVSKAEGRLRRLDSLVPSQRAAELAEVTGKDARLMELVLAESAAVVRAGRDVVIVEHRLGHVMANAGIDRSNVDAEIDDEEVALLLPEDPDRSARELRARLSGRAA
jgi:coenzyme F420-0:L-glutamate ligase/coenzyme F420-1:gamma-L-glutamate ligase